jgi:UTP--glucose-1-phosphate uridylyltransferase
VVAVQEIPLSETHKYGVVGLKNQQDSLGHISQIVEKPHHDQAPSNLGVVGRYILTPTIFDYLDTLSAGAGGEIQLTDAIAQLLTHEPVYAWQFAGTRYDCGSKLGYLQATLAYALKHPEVGQDFKSHLAQLL